MNETELPPTPESVEQIYSPTPDDPPWGTGSAFGLWGLSVLAILFFPVFFVIPYYLLNRAAVPADAEKDPNVILLSLAAIVPAHIFTLLISYPLVTKRRRYDYFKMLGWRLGNFRLWLLPVVVVVVYAAMLGISYIFPDRDDALMRMLQSSPAAAYSVAILATFFAPFVEEIVYRGVLYPAIQRSLGIGWAVLIVTFLFAGVHYMQYWGNPGSLIAITLLSLILTGTRALTGNLLPSVLLHFVFNALQSIAIIYTLGGSRSDSAAESLFYHIFK